MPRWMDVIKFTVYIALTSHRIRDWCKGFDMYYGGADKSLARPD